MKTNVWLRVAGWALCAMVPVTLAAIGFIWQVGVEVRVLSAKLDISTSETSRRLVAVEARLADLSPDFHDATPFPQRNHP